MLAAQLHPLTILALPLQLEQVLSKRLEEVEGKQAVSPCGCLSVRRAGLCVCVYFFSLFLCSFLSLPPSFLPSFPFHSLFERATKKEGGAESCLLCPLARHKPGTLARFLTWCQGLKHLVHFCCVLRQLD